jgi:catechol 2,3-dioxygenase-like lactoylglutathione lyase family enzyme
MSDAAEPHGVDHATRTELDARRADIAARRLLPRDTRPASTARGVHHVALICSDVERTVDFYDGVLGFPLIEMFENRDYAGSTHFFFDLGHGNTLAYFDLPGLDLGPYAEVLGGHHHLAISIDRANWQAIKDRFDEHGIEYAHVDGSSLYFRGPDGERLELISDPLLEMYGKPVG